MTSPVTSIGDMTPTSIPKGTAWTTLAVLHPMDGRTLIHGQFAVSLPAQRPTVIEVQLVELPPDKPPNPTGQDDRPMAFDLDSTGKVRIRTRQNWLYTREGRTYSDEPVRIEVRHNGAATLQLEWAIKAVLVRVEASR